MKKHSGGLGNFLNEITQTSEKNFDEEKIIYIDIDELESNPKNFYGLRDIDALAGLISVSKLIEPLIVKKNSSGKYTIISGHRRRAAVQKLIDEGTFQNKKLPCIVKENKKISIEQNNGEFVEFDEDSVEMLNLIASNRGQREERTLDEKLQEIKYLEKFARAIYNQKDRGMRGRFRNFFAEEILNISKSQLQRINSLENLTDEVKKAVDEKKISESAAMSMANLTATEQKKFLEKILSGEVKGTSRNIQSEKNSREKFSFTKIIDVPKKFEDPRKDAEDWFQEISLDFYESLHEFLLQANNFDGEEKTSVPSVRAEVVNNFLKKLKSHQQSDEILSTTHG